MKTIEDICKDNFKRHLKKAVIEDRDEILLLISTSFPWTGILSALFCNGFMLESVELIKNSIMVFEQGFFDAGFYFLRQSLENMNNMLLLYSDRKKLAAWKNKERFPNNKVVLQELSKLSSNYCEIKNVIPEWFRSLEETSGQVNKYIHKQGFDTYYEQYKNNEKTFAAANKLYNLFLKKSIAQLYLIYIALNPISLLLADEKMIYKVHFDLMDEPVPLSFLNSVFEIDLLAKMETTKFYSELKEYFNRFEALNYETDLLIKYQMITTKNIERIKEQAHLIKNPLDNLAVEICSISRASYIFFSSLILSPYHTDIEPLYRITQFCVDMFHDFLHKEETNIEWNGMRLCSFIKNKNEYVVIISNKCLQDEETKRIKRIIVQTNALL